MIISLRRRILLVAAGGWRGDGRRCCVSSGLVRNLSSQTTTTTELVDKESGGEFEESSAHAARFQQMRLDMFGAMKKKYPEWRERVDIFRPCVRIPQFVAQHSHLKPGEKAQLDSPVVLAGRMMNMRESGKKLVFLDLIGDGEKIQIHATEGSFQANDGPSFGEMVALLQRGDIVGVTGIPGRTPRGELSLYANSIKLVAPCVVALPATHFGFRDPNLRYRYRHLDMMMNAGPRQALATRALVMRTIRSFLDGRGFIEVETPMMSVSAGGASARPFKTRHIEMGKELFMRVAPELWLKRCVIGGIDRVYEIGKSFRNEGVDSTHNPEFTTVEAYHAYWNYNDLMRFTEELMREVVFVTTGGLELSLGGGDSPSTLVSFAKDFQRLSFLETIEAGLGRSLPRDFENPDSVAALIAAAEEHRVFCPAPKTAARVLDKLADHFIVPLCTQPTFITNTPAIMSPLAKLSPTMAGVSERFELVVNGMEVVNAYSELTDPQTQRANFDKQMKDRAAGDDEAQDADEPFAAALDAGLPPTGGWGLGVDRLCMLVTNSRTIKEVMAFPFIRPASQ